MSTSGRRPVGRNRNRMLIEFRRFLIIFIILASLSDYYVLVKKLEVEKFEDPYEILKLTSIGGNQPSWLNNKNEWPGEHQQNAKFKVAKWLDAGDVKTGELLFIGCK